jgi:hypothetical protein
MPEGVPSRRAFLIRTHAVALAVSVTGVVLMALYLAALLRMTPEQWSRFVVVVAAAFALLFLGVNLANRRIFEPILRALDGWQAIDEAGLRSAYRRVAQLPGLTFCVGEAWWLAGGVGVVGAMALFAPGFRWRQALVMVLAAASGGLVVMIFHYFLQKRELAGLRIALARRLGGPETREGLSQPVGIRTKLLVAVAGVTLVVVVFTLLLADVQAQRPLESALGAVQGAFARELVSDGVAPDAAARLAERARALAGDAAARELGRRRTISVAVLLLGAALAVGVVLVVSRDVVESTRALAGEVERIAAGDLGEAI